MINTWYYILHLFSVRLSTNECHINSRFSLFRTSKWLGITVSKYYSCMVHLRHRSIQLSHKPSPSSEFASRELVPWLISPPPPPTHTHSFYGDPVIPHTIIIEIFVFFRISVSRLQWVGRLVSNFLLPTESSPRYRILPLLDDVRFAEQLMFNSNIFKPGARSSEKGGTGGGDSGDVGS